MSRWVSLSKAARLAAISRTELQEQIRNGQLESFEGQVDLDALSRLLPQAELEHDASLSEQMNEAVESALLRARYVKLSQLTLPDSPTLAKRITALSRELSTLRAELKRYRGAIDELKQRITERGAQGGAFAAELERWLELALTSAPTAADGNALQLRESFLRVVAAHVELTPSGHDFFVFGSDSLLDAAIKSGFPVKYGCSDGSCGLCAARRISGEVGQLREPLLPMSPEDIERGMLLTCCHTAVSDVVLEIQEGSSSRDIPLQRISARIRRRDAPARGLKAELIILDLKPATAQRFRFLAGQRARLRIGGGDGGDHPIASCPCDATTLQFHLRRGEPALEPLFQAPLPEGLEIGVEGPVGALTLPEAASRLLFIALEDGFAAIKGVMEQAVALDRIEQIELIWLASPGGHYLNNLCRAWDDALDHVHCRLGTLELEQLEATLGTMIEDQKEEREGRSIFIAGPAALIDRAKRALIAAAIPETQIHTQQHD